MKKAELGRIQYERWKLVLRFPVFQRNPDTLDAWIQRVFVQFFFFRVILKVGILFYSFSFYSFSPISKLSHFPPAILSNLQGRSCSIFCCGSWPARLWSCRSEKRLSSRLHCYKVHSPLSMCLFLFSLLTDSVHNSGKEQDFWVRTEPESRSCCFLHGVTLVRLLNPTFSFFMCEMELLWGFNEKLSVQCMAHSEHAIHIAPFCCNPLHITQTQGCKKQP